MRIFGYELLWRKIPPPLQPKTPEQKLFSAVDLVNIAWRELEQKANNPLRPWIIWEDKELVVTTRKGTIEVCYRTGQQP